MSVTRTENTVKKNLAARYGRVLSAGLSMSTLLPVILIILPVIAGEGSGLIIVGL